MSEITDLTKTIREENAENRAQAERIASGEGPYTQEQIEIARETLKKQDEQRALTKRTLGISERRMQKAEELNTKIQAQEQIMAEQKEALEAAGVDANNSEKYQKEQAKLDKIKAQRDKVSGAAKKEDEQKAKFRDSRTGKILGGIKDGIFGMSKSLGGLLKDGAKAGVSSIFGVFKKLALGGLALAALAFLNSPKFDDLMNFIEKTVIPAIGPFIENLKTFFSDILESFDKFFNDDDYKKSMAAFKKGNFSEGFKSMFTSLTKKDGLLDNILTDIVNIFLRALGKSEIGKGMNDTLFSIVDRFSFRMANVLIDAINSVFLVLPEAIRPKLLNKLDTITGQEILTEEEADLNKRLEKSNMSELEAKKKQTKEDFEAGKINALEAQDADVRANNEIKALKNKLEEEVENKFSLTAGAKAIVADMIKTSQAKGKDINLLFRDKREEQDLEVRRLERTIGKGDKSKETLDQLNKLKADISSLELARQRGFDTEGRGMVFNKNSQVIKQGDNTSVNIKSVAPVSKSFNAIQAAMIP